MPVYIFILYMYLQAHLDEFVDKWFHEKFGADAWSLSWIFEYITHKWVARKDEAIYRNVPALRPARWFERVLWYAFWELSPVRCLFLNQHLKLPAGWHIVDELAVYRSCFNCRTSGPQKSKSSWSGRAETTRSDNFPSLETFTSQRCMKTSDATPIL